MRIVCLCRSRFAKKKTKFTRQGNQSWEPGLPLCMFLSMHRAHISGQYPRPIAADSLCVCILQGLPCAGVAGKKLNRTQQMSRGQAALSSGGSAYWLAAPPHQPLRHGCACELASCPMLLAQQHWSQRTRGSMTPC